MRKHEELTNPSSCMNRARDDEWTFVLLGRDAAAPAAVRAWIEERVRLGKNRRDDAQILEAERWIVTVTAEQLAAKVVAVPGHRKTVCKECHGLGYLEDTPSSPDEPCCNCGSTGHVWLPDGTTA